MSKWNSTAQDTKNLKPEDEVAIGGSIGGSIEELTARQQEVLLIIKDNPKISYRILAEQLNINDSAVKKHIEILKEKGVLIRIGGTRGYWKIIRH